MTELLPRPKPLSEDDKEQLFQRMVVLWQRMKRYPIYDEDGEIVDVEIRIAEVVENLADRPKNELPSKT